VIGLGVPLAQGWALGRPQAGMLEVLPAEVAALIRAAASRASFADAVVSLVRPARAGRDRETCDVLLAPNGLVTEVVDAAGRWVPAMTVAPSASVVDVVRRAMVRDDAHRWDPLVCTDATGAVVGTLAIDALVLAVSDAVSPTA
jgi:hypothetical protein